MVRIGVFLAEGLEEIEGLTAVDILRRSGIEVLMISISDQLSVTGNHNITIMADTVLKDVDFEKLHGLVLPGGMPGTKHLAEHLGVVAQIKDFYLKKKLVAAICAAPSVLGAAGLLQNKTAVCYPGYEDKLTGAIISKEDTVRDEHIITSRAMGTAIPFALAIAAYFLGKEKADEIKASILYGL